LCFGQFHRMRNRIGFFLRFLSLITTCSASGLFGPQQPIFAFFPISNANNSIPSLLAGGYFGVPLQRPAVAYFQRPSIYFQPQSPFGFQYPNFGGGGFARPAPVGFAQPNQFITQGQGQIGFFPSTSLPLQAAPAGTLTNAASGQSVTAASNQPLAGASSQPLVAAASTQPLIAGPAVVSPIFVQLKKNRGKRQIPSAPRVVWKLAWNGN